MSDKSRIAARLNAANVFEEFDKNTFEVSNSGAVIWYAEEFLGAAKGGATFPTTPTIGFDWIKKTVQSAGSPSVAGIANAAFGAIQLALDATSEKQEASLYWADNLQLDVTKGLVFECRVKLSVLPSAAGVQAVFGLSSAWIDGPDNASYYAEMGANGSGLIKMRSQDQVTQNNLSSPTTVLATDWHIYRIDLTNVNDVGFYIDGVQQNTAGQVKFAATGANAILQPYFSCYKPSGTGVATMQLDYAKVYANRS
jgi:hypothetical protein